MVNVKVIDSGKMCFILPLQGRRQNLKQVPQNFMKVFNVDEVTVTS